MYTAAGEARGKTCWICCCQYIVSSAGCDPVLCSSLFIPNTGAATLQVADAEAATARLVAQMTESSPNQAEAKSWPLQLLTGQKAGDVRSEHNAGAGQQHQQHQQHSSDRENVPQLQQHAGKRGSSAQSEQALPGADLVAGCTKKPAKRRKVSRASAGDAAAADGAGSGTSAGLPADVQEIVGRAVQQQFQEGVFKVGASSALTTWLFPCMYMESMGYTLSCTCNACTPLALPACLVLAYCIGSMVVAQQNNRRNALCRVL